MPSSTSNAQSVLIDAIPVQTPSSTSNAQSVPVDTILAVVFGVCVIFLLLIVGLILIWLCVIKKKRKEDSQAVNGGLEPLEAIYEDPDAALGDNFQFSFAQSEELKTAANVAYSTQLQVLQDKGVKTKDNSAYGVVSTAS